MRRPAGTKLNELPPEVKQALSMPSAGPGANALSAAAALGVLAPQLYGIYDLFAGEANGVNSGELGLNYLISGVPTLTATAGAVIPYFTDQDAKDAFDLMYAGSSARSGRPVPASEIKVAMDVMERRRPEIDQLATELRAKGAIAEQDIAKEVARRSFYSRGQRNIAAGAAIGGIAAAIPAIMAMRDQPAAPIPASPEQAGAL